VKPSPMAMRPWQRAVYRALRALFEVLCRIVWRMEVDGRDRLPATGPYVIAPVHRSNVDFAVVGAAVPRVVRFMAKDAVWKVRIAGWFVEQMGSFPVNRDQADRAALRRCEESLAQGDPVVYDIRYHPFQTSTSDMALGVSTIYPGKVGDEYHMTKGHFHVRMDQPEIYFCVRGTGFLLMESKEGDFQVAEWRPGTITHIPPQYAHRVVNTGPEPLIWVASYHLAAGHDYEPIIARGFAKIVVEKDGQPVFLPNPRRPNSS